MEGNDAALRPVPEDQEEEAGRAVLRDLLVNRLTAAGLRPRKGLTGSDHARCMTALVVQLSYMSREMVDVLAETVLTEAAKPGPSHGYWPSEVLIRQWAEALQPRPFREHPIIRSWLRSREGPLAEAGGYLVPLFRWLKRHRRAVLVYDLQQIRVEGRDEQQRISAIRQRLADGRDWPDDRERLEAWLRDHEEALQYVDEGRMRRAILGGAADGSEGTKGEAA